ncbi:MAG: mycofactocin precursor peptide peptidase [Frankiales bacterium]|nr:mycofactocin precursor peptide peptidase [Frankiales bacterium]
MTRLGDLTWPGVEADVLAVPLGSTEQHGPHLPLSTDTDIAQALAHGLASRRADVLVAPPVPYGASGEHAGFRGTLSIGHEALELLLVELVRSATESFPHVLLVNGHGGNVATLSAACARLRDESRDVLVWSPAWRGDAHAGRTETSVQLALDASRVGTSRDAGATDNLADLMPALRRGGLRAVTDNGVLGDPAGASAEEGQALLLEALDDLEKTVVAWLTTDSA